MAGYTLTALDINNRAGSLAFGLWTALEDVRRFKLWLDDAAHSDANIGPSSTVGVPTADLTVIRNSFADLGGTSGLYAVSHGTFAPAGVSNYFANAKLLTGLNYAA
jgi:hypothetical protein